jgi:hypothetical protein
MSSPIIHINKRFHVEADNIIKVVQKKHGSVYVYFNDGKSERPKIAIAKTTMTNILTIINNYRVMNSKKPILGVYEK